MLDDVFTLEEIEDAVKHLKRKKSVRADLVSAEHLEYGGSGVCVTECSMLFVYSK